MQSLFRAAMLSALIGAAGIAAPSTAGAVSVSYTGIPGIFVNEVSYEVVPAAGGAAIFAEGPFISIHSGSFEAAPGDYILNMFDTFGDGWNGYRLLFTVGTLEILNTTLATGSSGTQNFTVPGSDVPLPAPLALLLAGLAALGWRARRTAG
ncbi:hypothetical protein LNKW23_40150 [Paralimibaculum aggregatum]|uniref:VPLPA-CTERM sorting domain-containing protein n=1 Tax=Paralimibaculum aggregatum TaxID=3036245 RepID=A0ABQ6LNK7_9RHOB|nr:hypothetical protein [Limibaculum sp. NKW23]GMG84799.1 hypothetical protein LNKW23_40150 [Limibaculum sp. NKW23]